MESSNMMPWLILAGTLVLMLLAPYLSEQKPNYQQIRKRR